MLITFNITKVTILKGNGTDKVFLWTTFPPTLPKVSDQSLCLGFDVERGVGENYVKDKLGISDYVVIE